MDPSYSKKKYYEHLSQGLYKVIKHFKDLKMECIFENDQKNEKCLALKSEHYVQYNPTSNTYSRKVFIGGLPLDITEEKIISFFERFGSISVDWPIKMETKNTCPGKGYAFILFSHEFSVRLLCEACIVDDNKFMFNVNINNTTDKYIQVRPWKLADADYLVAPNVKINTRNTIFVGAVPRLIKAGLLKKILNKNFLVELAHIMDRLYGPVACAGIDIDVEYKYPKGAGRVVFFHASSFNKAISARYVSLYHGDIEKHMEIKPYVLDDQPCDECCVDRHAPFFCPQISCLQYYCENCWTKQHAQPEFDQHKPLVKEA